MPCSEPRMSDRDKRTARAAKLLLIFSIREGFDVPEWVSSERWIWPYGKHCDEVTALLCDFCKRKGEDFIYNGRDADCRKLADWWDDHKKIDDSAPEGQK